MRTDLIHYVLERKTGQGIEVNAWINCHYENSRFAECLKALPSVTLGIVYSASLPSVVSLFAECCVARTRQISVLPSILILPSVSQLPLDKHVVC